MDIPSYIESLVPTLLNKIIIPAVIPGPKTTVLCSAKVVHVVALIINAVVRETEVSVQNAFYIELFKLFVSGEPSGLISNEEVTRRFRPLTHDADSHQTETVQIFASAVAAAHKEVSLKIITYAGRPSRPRCNSISASSHRDRHRLPHRPPSPIPPKNDGMHPKQIPK